MGEKTDTYDSAQQLLARGNYALAKRAFVRLAADRSSADAPSGEQLQSDIALCDRELDKLRAKDLAKKAKRCITKGQVAQAVALFEQAQALSPEPWIGDLLAKFAPRAASADHLAQAHRALQQGDYSRAADLYGQAFAIEPKLDTLVRQARALVRAQHYAEAIASFEQAGSRHLNRAGPATAQPTAQPKGTCVAATSSAALNVGAVYDHGFAHMKLGDYHRCLRVWDTLPAPAQQQAALVQQRRAVERLLVAHRCEQHARNLLPTRAHEEVLYLQQTTDQTQLQPVLAALQQHIWAAWVQQQWNERRVEAIAEVLDPTPRQMPPQLLALYAKVGFSMAQRHGATRMRHLDELRVFWLTALYHPHTDTTLSQDPTQIEAVRAELVQRARGAFELRQAAGTAGGRPQEAPKADATARARYAGESAGESADAAAAMLAVFDVEHRLVRQVRALWDTQRDGQQAATPWVATPSFARRFGGSDAIVAAISNDRDHFDNKRDLLDTGAHYTAVGPSLLLVAAGRAKEAVLKLPGNRPSDCGADNPQSHFVEFGVRRVRFAYGLDCLDQGDARVAPYFENLSTLFEVAPEYEKALIAHALQARTEQQIVRYQEALEALTRGRCSSAIREVAAELMCLRATAAGLHGLAGMRTARNMLAKAVALDPGNDKARSALETCLAGIEWDEMDTALAKGQFPKAAKLAMRSDDDDIRERFLSAIDELVSDSGVLANEPRSSQLVLLSQVQQWCRQIDPNHPVTDKIASRLRAQTAGAV